MCVRVDAGGVGSLSLLSCEGEEQLLLSAGCLFPFWDLHEYPQVREEEEEEEEEESDTVSRDASVWVGSASESHGRERDRCKTKEVRKDDSPPKKGLHKA